MTEWTEVERLKFRRLCQALYNPEDDTMKNENRGESPVTMQAEKAMVNSEQAEPGVTIGRSALHYACLQAERAADEMNAQVNDLKQQRDGYARQVGATQDMIDRLQIELNKRTAHVRTLQAAIH